MTNVVRFSSKEYLKALYERKNGASEFTYRPPFESFLKEMLPDYEIKQELKRSVTKGIAPDFIVFSKEVSDAVIGYIETKEIGSKLNANSEQIKKYRAVHDNIILTNYLTFLWISGENTKEVTLLSFLAFTQDELHVSKEVEGNLRMLFDAFGSRHPKSISDLKELAKFLAPRTLALKGEIFFSIKG